MSEGTGRYTSGELTEIDSFFQELARRTRKAGRISPAAAQTSWRSGRHSMLTLLWNHSGFTCAWTLPLRRTSGI